MIIFKKCNPSILEQDVGFVRVNMSATKLTCQQILFVELWKKAHLINPGDNYNVYAR